MYVIYIKIVWSKNDLIIFSVKIFIATTVSLAVKNVLRESEFFLF